MLDYQLQKIPSRFHSVVGRARSAFQLRYYHPPPPATHGVLISVSASGETPQTLKAQAAFTEKGGYTFALTNRALSSLVEFADASFSTNIPIGKFHHPVATTTTGIWAIQVLTANLISTDPHTPGYAEAYHSLQRLPALLKQLSSNTVLRNELAQGAEALYTLLSKSSRLGTSNTQSIHVVTGGALQPIANLLRLKIGELSWEHATCFNVEEYIHSPLLTADTQTPLIFLIPDLHVYHRIAHLSTFMKQHNISFLDIAPQEIPRLPASHVSIRFASKDIPPAYLGIPFLYLCQRFALLFARKQSKPPQGWRYGKPHAQLINNAQ